MNTLSSHYDLKNIKDAYKYVNMKVHTKRLNMFNKFYKTLEDIDIYGLDDVSVKWICNIVAVVVAKERNILKRKIKKLQPKIDPVKRGIKIKKITKRRKMKKICKNINNNKK